MCSVRVAVLATGLILSLVMSGAWAATRPGPEAPQAGSARADAGGAVRYICLDFCSMEGCQHQCRWEPRRFYLKRYYRWRRHRWW